MYKRQDNIYSRIQSAMTLTQQQAAYHRTVALADFQYHPVHWDTNPIL